MAILYLGDDAFVKSYSSSTKGKASTLRIEITISDPMRLGHLLSELADIERDQRARQAPVKATKPKSEAPQLALPAPFLRIAHNSESEQ